MIMRLQYLIILILWLTITQKLKQCPTLLFFKMKKKLVEFYNKLFLKLLKNKIRSEKTEILNLKNIHKGEKCFIIGNGPSLNAKDLDLLAHEITFSCNMIFDLMKYTKWKPYYYFSHDPGYLKRFNNQINNLKAQKKFIGYYHETAKTVMDNYLDKNEDYVFYEILKNDNCYQKIDFSLDVTNGVYPSGTVSYAMIQFAVYMGFKEIYLLGFDHTLGAKTGNTHFEGYSGNKTTNVNVGNITLGFIKAKEISEISDFEIFNSTRGGLLEVFERKKLEDVI